MWLLRRLAPDFKTLTDFRKDNAQAIRGVCREFIGYCRDLRLFGGELIAIDGPKPRLPCHPGVCRVPPPPTLHPQCRWTPHHSLSG